MNSNGVDYTVVNVTSAETNTVRQTLILKCNALKTSYDISQLVCTLHTLFYNLNYITGVSYDREFLLRIMSECTEPPPGLEKQFIYTKSTVTVSYQYDCKLEHVTTPLSFFCCTLI